MVLDGLNRFELKKCISLESFQSIRVFNFLGVTDRRQKVVFHTLRYTFASWLVEAGTEIYTMKEPMATGPFP